MLNLQICLLTALAVLFGYFLAQRPQPPPELKIKGVAWCYVAEYKSMKAYDEVQPLPYSLIDVHSKGVTVYTGC